MYLSVHILCMNDCTLPIHLNSNLHITSTLILAIKCAVCLCTHSFLDCHRQVCQSVRDLHPCFLRTTQWNLFAEKTFPKRRSAFCNDCNRWKCFTTHFHSFVVINKIALNCIHSYIAVKSLICDFSEEVSALTTLCWGAHKKKANALLIVVQLYVSLG